MLHALSNLTIRFSRPRFGCAVLLFLAYCGATSAAEKPPVDITVYYSKEDPRWKTTEASIDAVGKEFPRLRITKVLIDDEAGYKALHDAEKRLRIDPTGEITLVMGPYYLTSKGDRRGIETYFRPVVARVLKPGQIKGRRLPDAKAFARHAFGKGVECEQPKEDKTRSIRYHRVLKAGKHVGWVVDAHREVRCPVCNDTQFMVAVVLPELKVTDIRLVRPLERYGRVLDQKEMDGFVKQFRGRTIKNAKADVDTISGATKTSRAYRAAFGELMDELKKRLKSAKP